MKDRTRRRRGGALRTAAVAMTGLLPLAGGAHPGLAHDGRTREAQVAMAPDHAMPPAHGAARVQAAAMGVNEVSVTNFQFQPAVLTVRAGTRVSWTNRDTTPHTVTSRDARFTSSAGMDTNDQHAVVFDRPGTYEYFCSLHPMMVGKVIVEPGG
jgi:plastocyanin